MEIRRPKISSVPAPRAPYSQVVVVGGFVYISGQVGNDPERGIPNGIEDQTRIALGRIDKILLELGLGLDRLIKVNVFLINMDDFGPMNDIYAELLPNVLPARTTLAVVALPRPELRIEIDAVAAL